MVKTFERYWNLEMSILFGVGLFLFWYLYYPHALSYQEQYQLFLWTGDYFAERVSVPGGFADWLGEFIVQFYYVGWLGALALAMVFVAFGWLAGWIPAALLIWLLGDPNVLLGYVMALILAVGAYRLNRLEGLRGLLSDIIIVPIVYWLTGPVAWVYVILRLIRRGWKWQSLMVLYLIALQLIAYNFILLQWPRNMVLMPMQYYRIPLQMNTLMWVIPIVIVVAQSILVLPFFTRKKYVSAIGILTIVVVLAWLGINKGYDKDMYELIREDYLVRNEQWDEIVNRARDYQVHTAFSSVCVNLALAEKRQLADRMFDFYQSGEDALIMPRIRDLTSMLPSAEVFWRLGMVNSAQRYMFDTQESILNGKKSGRCTKRIAECMIVNGHYQAAAKQIDILKKSLYYSDWAKEAEQLLNNDAKVDAHPVYSKLRKLRYKEDYLYSYAEIDKMFGLLFLANNSNKMALDYFMGQMLLKGNMQGFQQYMGWVQQYGGYRMMPIGYQDAMLCVQKQGAVPGSPYANYAKRMMAERRKDESR